MARIAGVNIPQDKVVHVALTYIHGVGKKFSNDICTKLNIAKDKRVNSLTEEEVLKIREFIDKNYKVAHEMILFASQNLYKNDKIMASEAQNKLSEMYIKGIGTIKNNIEAYKWLYIANITSNTNSLNLLSNLKSLISEEEEILAIKEAKLFLSKISNKEDNQ